MRTVWLIAEILFVFLLAIETGCNPQSVVNQKLPSESVSDSNISDNEPCVYKDYLPVKIDIMPLTEMVDENSEGSGIKAYVSLLDSFGCQVKSPGVFRFELYERVMRSAEPKGRRIHIWPDIDLTPARKNNNYWRDFLRAYAFSLDLDFHNSRSYILSVTCICPKAGRLSADFLLKPAK